MTVQSVASGLYPADITLICPVAIVWRPISRDGRGPSPVRALLPGLGIVFPSSPKYPSPHPLGIPRQSWPEPGTVEDCLLQLGKSGRAWHAFPCIRGKEGRLVCVYQNKPVGYNEFHRLMAAYPAERTEAVPPGRYPVNWT